VGHTETGSGTIPDEIKVRRASLLKSIPIVTTVPGAKATLSAIKSYLKDPITVKALQEYFA